MTKDKYLYDFTVPREIEKEQEEIVDDGKLIKKIKSIQNVKFAILRPTRQIIDDADLFYGVKNAEFFKKGLLSRAQVAKRIANDNGILSDQDIQNLSQLRVRLFELSNEATRLTAKTEIERSDTEKKELEDKLNEFIDVRRKIQNYESLQESLYEHTSETKAKYKTILWYVLFLSHVENDKGNLEPLFKGETYEDKLKAYDIATETDDDCLRAAIERLGYLVTFFYHGTNNREEFDALYKDFIQSSKLKAELANETPESGSTERTTSS